MKPSRPEASEYAPYYEKYISLVAGSDALNVLGTQGTRTVQLCSKLGEVAGDFRYAPDKWTVKEVLGHISDTERIFTYRALRIGRGDKTAIEGFEQDEYVRGGAFSERTLKSLLEEFAAVRSATTALYGSLNEEAWTRRGTANSNEISVKALAFITAGHELHHRKILEERYFPAIPHP